MPMYEVVTPLRNGGPKPIKPTSIVELDENEGEPLRLIGALAPAAADAKPDADTMPPPKPLAKQNKGELIATAEAEGVELPADATNAVMVAAIEAKRKEAAQA